MEVKRKKPVPTEARKPWDDRLAKFSLKRAKAKPAPGGRRGSGEPDDLGKCRIFLILSFN